MPMQHESCSLAFAHSFTHSLLSRISKVLLISVDEETWREWKRKDYNLSQCSFDQEKERASAFEYSKSTEARIGWSECMIKTESEQTLP